MTEDLGRIAENIKEGNEDKCEQYIGSLFAWVFALANVADFRLDDAIWKKYPGYCPYCGLEENCRDAWWTSVQMRKGKHPKKKKKQIGSKPKNLESWLKTWNKIYGSKIRVAIPLHDIMHKLYEELTEVLQEFDKMSKNESATRGVREEVPDFFSWLFDLIIKLRHYRFIDRDRNIAEILYKKFPNVCHWCKKAVCECPQITWLK